MGLLVIKRPQGYVINKNVAYTATFSRTIGGVPVFTKTSPTLITGQVIYVESNFDKFNGFMQVENITANTFYIQEPGTATYFYPFEIPVSGTITFYLSVATHGWSAVHLPITYQFRSSLWPLNLVDTTQTVSSYSNDNGYVNIVAGGVIKSDLTELEFVKITYVGGTTAVYQVLSWYSNSRVTINLSYAGGITFSTIQYYYNNYHARIRVYAGLSNSHYLKNEKPYTLVTEQKVIPASDGFFVININEFLKEQIEILKNDLTLETLQNNIDAFCQFYIEYAEGYDYSTGGYTLLDYVSSYTTDSFVGQAVNADLPFKNMHSGFLSDYIYGSSATKLKFLTPSLYPELLPGQYFDISFVNQIGALLRIRRECLQNGVIIKTFIDPINDYGVGIYRYELAQSIFLEDQILLTIEFFDYVSWVPISETKSIAISKDCSCFTPLNLSWLNYTGAFDYKAFCANSDYGVTIEATKTVKKNIFQNWPKSYGAGADTISQQTSRESRQNITVRAEALSMEQIDDLYRIRTSPLVQIVNSRTDRRTVIVDGGSFVYKQQGEKLFNLQFNISLTDNLPSQSL